MSDSQGDQTADAPDEWSAQARESAAQRPLAQVAIRVIATILQVGVLFMTLVAGLTLSGSQQGVFAILALLQAVIVLAVVIGRVFLWSSAARRRGATLVVLLVPLASMALSIVLFLLAGFLIPTPG